MATTQIIQVEFYLYIDNLRQYRNCIALKNSNAEINLEQLVEVHEDIFYYQQLMTPEQLASFISYEYVLKNKNGKTNEIKRQLKRFRMQTNMKYPQIMIFDTPAAFYENQNMFAKIVSDEKVMLSQSNPSESLLMFVQARSTSDLLKGLISFIKQNSFQNENSLLKKINERIYAQMKQSLEQSQVNPQYYIERLGLLQKDFKERNSYSIFKALQEIYVSTGQNVNSLSIDQSEELKGLTRNFTFQQWLLLLFEKRSILQQQDILQRMDATIGFESYKSLESCDQKVQQIPSLLNNENKKEGKELVFKYWYKCFQAQNDLEKLNFLLSISERLKTAFSDNGEMVYYLMSEYLELVIKNKQCFDQFLKQLNQIILFIDPDLKKVLSFFQQNNFMKLSVEQRIDLFLAIQLININLQIDFQSFVNLVGNNVIIFENLKRILLCIADAHPELNYYQALTNAFVQISALISVREFYQFISLKEQFLELAQKINGIQQKQLQLNNGNQVEMNGNHQQQQQQKQEFIDIQMFSNKLDESIITKVNRLTIDQLLSCCQNLAGVDNIKNSEKVLNLVIANLVESQSKNNDQFLSAYFKIYSEYMELKQGKALNRNSQSIQQVYVMIISEFEKIAIRKYEQSKQINNHFYESFTYNFLTIDTVSNKFRQLVDQDITSLVTDIQKVEISQIEKLFSSQTFKGIIDFLQNGFNTKPYLDLINNYKKERYLLQKFFGSYKSYLTDDSLKFENAFIANPILNQLQSLISQYSHLKNMYNFHNLVCDLTIFQKIYQIVEEKMPMPNGRTIEVLKTILQYSQDNLIKFSNLLIKNENNQNSLVEYRIQPPKLADDLSIDLVMDEEEKQLDLFINGQISVKQLKDLCGNTYENSILSISLMFNTIKHKFTIQSLENILNCAYSNIFLNESGSLIIKFAKQCKMNLQSQENFAFSSLFQAQMSQEELNNRSIHSFLNLGFINKYKLLFIQGGDLKQQITLLGNLDNILTYMVSKLKLQQSFLDLRELVDEDNIDVISLLIKLNNYYDVFMKIIEFKDKTQQDSFTTLIEKVTQFSSQYLRDPRIYVDLNECIEHFYKIQNISQSLDKKKQFISIICEILESGVIYLKLDENGSKIRVDISCQKKEYTELEMKQICSKVMLEQNTTTNILIAAAQANILKNKKNLPFQKEKTFQQNIFEVNRIEQIQLPNRKIFDDFSVNNNKRQQKEEEEELQLEISSLKTKMQLFRDQWFLVEQLKEILLEHIEFGHYDILNPQLVYSNQVDKEVNGYQVTTAKMKANLQEFESTLVLWKEVLEIIFEQYPLFTLVGFMHYKELITLYNSRFSNPQISQELLSLLSYLKIPIQTCSIYFSNLSQNQNVCNDTYDEKLNSIAAFIHTNSQVKDNSINPFSQKSICQVQYLGTQELMKLLIGKIQHSEINFKFHQFFYYEKFSRISDLELFMYRFRYLKLSNEYFIIFNQDVDLTFYSKAVIILQEKASKEKDLTRSLFILLNREVKQDIIPDIPITQQEIMLQSSAFGTQISEPFISLRKYINFVHSDFPGTGKTFYIQQQQNAKYQNESLRIPFNGSGEKQDLIELFRNKMTGLNGKNVKFIHLDLYEMQGCDINYLLFELIVLKSFSTHANKLIYMDQSIHYYIEIQNSLKNEFFNRIYFKEQFNSTSVKFNVNEFQVLNSNLSAQDNINQYFCYKYLLALQQCQQNKLYLDQTQLPIYNYVQGDQSFKTQFQNLLQTFFVNKLQELQIQPCFQKMKHFIQLFGSEMTKYEKCVYIDFNILSQHQNQLLKLGLRSEILRTSYNLCLQVSVNRLNNQGIIGGNNLSKDQMLHNKAQSIQKFNSLMMNFVTFQEQEDPCVTTFFDRKEQVPKCILDLFDSQKDNLIYFDQQNRPEVLLKWLIRLINKNENLLYNDQKSIEFSNIKKKEIQDIAQKITIQKDNFFKIAMIFMRIRSNTPVIIMGQSGIGKTALIEVMSLIMEADFITMNVHAGITESDVVKFINQFLEQKDKKIILFFDEVNTNKMVGGLFKEILVDRCIKGRKIPTNIIPIAAINPYKLKSEKQKEIINMQIHGGIKQEIVNKIKNTDLEYMVEPIPDSMYNFIWNFDSLNKEDEKNYIQQMVLIKNQIKLKKNKQYQQYKFTQDQLNLIGSTLVFAQEKIREQMGYESACSLRDVSRFNRLLFWFVKTLAIFQMYGLEIQLNNLTTYAICLSFFISYAVRLPLPQQRRDFLRDCAIKLNIKEVMMSKSIHDVITFLIDQTEVPLGIVKNTSLKSNVFTLFVSIMNKIPVVLIGPPGCSKSLSLSILIKSLKGEQSKSPLFMQFKAVMQLFYQGHIQSTSERIQEVFDKAISEQVKIKQQNQNKKYLSLVQIEEIGLAEISPHNPLKVLHSILEKPQIAVACISNWPLDQSKMNRMLNVYRLQVDLLELTEIVDCIQDHIIKREKEQYVLERLKQNKLSQQQMNKISQIYLDYLSLMKLNLKKYEQFHGLRDFYSTVKLFYQQMLFKIKLQKDQVRESETQEELILKCYLRHFSGLQDSRKYLIQAFQKQFNTVSNNSLAKLSLDLELFESNLRERSDYFISRHLMIITENTQFAAEYISEKLQSMKKPYKCLIGSDFKDDQTTENSHQVINQIISCVESGIIVIIQNLDNIYQSLYELLNQNYRDLNGKPYCKISFGADSSNIQVTEGFKLILLAQSSQIHRMDGPLLNRFEKHHFAESMTVNVQDLQKQQEIRDYFESAEVKNIFNFTNLREVAQSLVIQQIRQQKIAINQNPAEQQLQNNDILQKMYRLIPLSKTLTFVSSRDEQLKTQYIESNYHFSLPEFIKWRILANQPQKNTSNLITIYTPSEFTHTITLQTDYCRIYLSQLNSQNKLSDEFTKLTKNLISDNQLKSRFINNPQTIFIVADLKNDSIDRLLFIRQKISESYSMMEKELQPQVFKNINIVIIIKIIDEYAALPFAANWEQYYLEDLYPLNFITQENLKNDFRIYNLLDKKAQNFLDVINFNQVMSYCISNQENITHSYKSIQYKQINKEGYQTVRLTQIWEIFQQKNNNLSQFISLILQIITSLTHDKLQTLGVQTVDDFIRKCVLSKKFLQQTQSLQTSIWMTFNEIIQQSISLVLYQLEKNNLLFMTFNAKDNRQTISQIINKILRVFGLQILQYDFNSGIYNGQVNVEKFRNLTKLELDSNMKDLEFYESERILAVIYQTLKRSNSLHNGITSNSQQNQLKWKEFNETFTQIEKSMRELCNSEDLKAIQIFKKEFEKDSQKYSQFNISEFQKVILKANIAPIQMKIQNDENILQNVIQEIVFHNFYSRDLDQVEILLNEFKHFANPEVLFSNFSVQVSLNQCQATIRDFLNQMVIGIHSTIQPSEKLFKIVKAQHVDFEGCIKQLIQFIDLYQLQSQNNTILTIKQQLIVLSCFYQDIIHALSVHQKVLNFIVVEYFQNLDIRFIQDFKDLLKPYSQMPLDQQSVLIGMAGQGEQNQMIISTQEEEKFEVKWQKFLLEMMLSSVKCQERQYSTDFTKSIFSLVSELETFYTSKQREIPDEFQIKINLILQELSLSMNSKEKLIQIFKSDPSNRLIISNTTETASLTIFSNALQQNCIQILIPNLYNIDRDLIQMIYLQLNNLSIMQKLIYFAIFRHIVSLIIKSINDKTYQVNADPALKQFFDNIPHMHLQYYIVKAFYNQYKQGDIMIQKMRDSPYFKDNTWLKKYSAGFSGLLSSSFYNENLMQLYKQYFENKNDQFKNLLRTYLATSLRNSNNAFGEIYKGNLQLKSFYPFMMYNNIYLFHRDTKNNTQLYQCSNCLEFIFSNACPHLQSKTACLQCGVQIAYPNQYTRQILTGANSNLAQLENIKKQNQWEGFYLRLEEDTMDFKIDQGFTLDLRIFALLYYFSVLLAFEQNKYTKNLKITVFSNKLNRETSANTLEINKLLRIHYEANPKEFINEQINIAIDHILKIMKTNNNASETETYIILFKIINQLLSDQEIRVSSNAQQRAQVNQTISQKIQQVISQSSQVLLNSKSDHVAAILEKENPTQQKIEQMYLRNLRSQNMFISTSFIQNYIKQNLKNEEFRIMKQFLDSQNINYLSDSLKSLIHFTQQMNLLFVQTLSKKKAQELTLLEALGNQRNHPLYQYYINHLIPNWKKIREYEIEYDIGCKNYKIQLIDEKTKLNNLIFTDDKEYGYFPNIIELLINKQNNLINNIHQLSLSEKPEQFGRLIKQIENIVIDPNSKNEKKLKELVIQNIDCERHIVKKVSINILHLYFMSNTQYSKGLNEYVQNFNLLQEELVQQVLHGAVTINLKESQKFFFLYEINQIGQLSNNQIEQEKLSNEMKQRLIASFSSKTQIFELLQQLSTVFQMFKTEKSQSNLSLYSALNQLQIKQNSPQISSIMQSSKLIHLNDIISCLEELGMEDLVELCNPVYKAPINKSQLEPVFSFVQRTVAGENFRIALGRFILRCLSQESDSIDPKQSLFETLFYIDVCEEFWNDASKLEDCYEEACRFKIKNSEAYELYKQTLIKFKQNKQIQQNQFMIQNNQQQMKPNNNNNNKNNNPNMYMDYFQDFKSGVKNYFAPSKK